METTCCLQKLSFFADWQEICQFYPLALNIGSLSGAKIMFTYFSANIYAEVILRSSIIYVSLVS